MKTITHQALEPQILYTRLFKRKFEQCLRLRPRRLDIVVPYIGKTPWGGIVDFSQLLIRMECEFCLTTLPPSDSQKNRVSIAEAKELSRMGVNFRVRSGSPLHSKIYQFIFRGNAKMAFVGSANFSSGGFENNDETVAFFQAKADNDKIANEIDRLSAGGSDYFQYLEIKS